MSMYGDGREIVGAMREADEALTAALSVTVSDVEAEFGGNTEGMAREILFLRLKVARLKQDIANDYWPGA